MKTLLLIDDDPAFQYSFQRACKKIKAVGTLQVANNGAEAVVLLLECIKFNLPAPQYIFVDINMPVMNGFEFIEKFQELKDEFSSLTSIIVLILTSSTQTQDKEKAFSSGLVKSYITKPDSMLELIGTIKDAIW